MATITFGKTGSRPYGVLTVTETSTSTTNNTSTLSIKLVLKRPSAIHSTATKKASCTINGTTYSWSGTIGGSGDKTLISKTQTVTHNNDGSKTISLSASITLSVTWSETYVGTISGSGSMVLTNIPRYATSNQSLASKTETSISINWSSNAIIDYIWYSSNNGSSWTGINVSDGTNGAYTISGLTADTNYKIKTRVRRKDNQLITDSSTLSVDTYAYPYANSMPNFTIGNETTMGLYNPLGRSITVSMVAADGTEKWGGDITGATMSGWNNSGWVSFLYSSIPNAKSGTYKIKVVYGSQTSIKTGGRYTVNANDCLPSISSVSYRDVNNTAVAITGNDQDIVRNQSIVEYTASGLAAQKSATISSCSVSVNNNSYNLSISGNTASGGNATIDSGSDVTATFTVTDSRGLTATKTLNVEMIDWNVPSAIITMHRQNNFYSETDITVNADYPSIGGHNNITITYKAKKTSDTQYTVTGTLQDNVQSTFVADNRYAWDVVVTLVDSFGGTTTYNLWLSKGTPIIYFDRIKSSTGINCFPQDDESFEVSGINIIKALYFQSGDSFSIVGNTSTNYANRLVIDGFISNSQKEVWFSVPTPKSMSKVTPTVSVLKLNIRTTDGTYLLDSAYIAGGYDVVGDSTITINPAKSTDNMLTIELQRSSSWTATNNTPVAIAIENITIDFT